MRKEVGRGKASIVYSDGVKAYKVFPENYDRKFLKYELDIQNEIYNKTKLPVLKYELDHMNHEIISDYINGMTLAQRMIQEKYKNGLNDFIELQASIYAYKDLDLPLSKDSFLTMIKESHLDENLKELAIKSLNRVEDMRCLCHFDFHYENIMYDGNKYFVIDWVNAKLGNPVLDIARSYLILKQYVKRQANKYLDLITKKLNINKKLVFDALPAMAFLRLLEKDVSDFSEQLISLVRE